MRTALQRAEEEVLARVLPSEAEVAAGGRSLSEQQVRMRQQAWRRSAAVSSTRLAMRVVRYPVETAGMFWQFSGTPTTQTLWQLSSSMATGMVFKWTGGGPHLRGLGLIVEQAFPVATVPAMVASEALHYAAYSLLYGLLRQSVAVRLQTAGGGKVPRALDVLTKAAQWARDVVLLRRPRGAVLSFYVRDIAASIVHGALSHAFEQLLRSQWAAGIYLRVLRVGRGLRRVGNRLRTWAGGLGRTPAPSLIRTARQLQAQYVDGQPTKQDTRNGDAGAFVRLAAGTLAAVLARAIMYPADAVVLRVVADETGLTTHAYAGFCDCLRRLARRPAGLRVLYSGFGRAMAVELGLGWLTLEIAHYLCKAPWFLS
ncbi:hypothetical protein H4R20_006044 [Coemansia guatemalensis]|uniref:Mitochondrial carrier n=1 Tax=Coemansia guatemalensis TaxID=2761395 RepID=A0A9W8HQ94_9FUNG|nr:hypothetical protein H4R20_006044 [Coemansia guatemalensis]